MRIRSLDPSRNKFAFAWYDREPWELLRVLSVDPQDLDDTFEQWELAAIRAEAEFLAQGCQVQRFLVTAAELQAWCRASRRPLDRASRSKFVAERAHLQAQAGRN
jgi:hypothetical protein